MTQQITELPALWQEAEQHIRAFEQLARRTVEEAWLAGDALLRIKQQLPHGAWTPALADRGISVHVAKRLIRLRREYPEIVQIARFDSVSAALTDRKKAKPEPTDQPKLIENSESAEHTSLADFVEPAEVNEPDKPAESVAFAKPVEEPYPNAGTGRLRRIEQISSGPRGIPKKLPPMRRRQLRRPGRRQGATLTPARPFFGVWVGPAKAPAGPQRVVWSIPLPSIRWKGFLNLSSQTGDEA